MKLRYRLVLLTSSVVTVPFLVALSIGLIQWRTEGFQQTLGTYLNARRWLEREMNREGGPNPQSMMTDLPNGLDLAVAGPDDLITASTTDRYPIGHSVDLETIREDQSEQVEIVLQELNTTEYIIAVLDRPYDFVAPTRLPPVILGPIVLLAPGIVISVGIIRGLRRSIFTLRDAAARISAGDLDFQIDSSGQDEFSEVMTTFETMRQTIKEEYGRRARFTMGVSHDLKTPLALIRGYAEAIGDGLAGDRETLERYAKIISERSDLLQARITHLIEFLRLETGEWKSRLTRTPLAAELRRIGDDVRADARLLGRTIDMNVEIPEELSIDLDPVLVQRAIENLIHNAIQNSPETTTVGVDVEGDEHHVEIRVRNRSKDGDTLDLELFSEPFYRGDSSRQRPGFGLGLSVVRSVVESHGWELTARQDEQYVEFVIIMEPSGE